MTGIISPPLLGYLIAMPLGWREGSPRQFATHLQRRPCCFVARGRRSLIQRKGEIDSHSIIKYNSESLPPNRDAWSEEPVLAQEHLMAALPLVLPSKKSTKNDRPCRTFASPALEEHFTCKELAELWHYSEDKIRRYFQDEPGVLRDQHPETCHKRAYVSMRIPKAFVERVHRKLCR